MANVMISMHLILTGLVRQVCSPAPAVASPKIKSHDTFAPPTSTHTGAT